MFQTAVDASRLSARKLRTTQCYFKSKKKRQKRKKIELEVSRINPFRVFFVKKSAVLCRYSAYVFVLMG